MKILFIEADASLDYDQQKFKTGLEKDNHTVECVLDCYDNASLCKLKTLLTNWCPEAIFVQTTFTYTDKLKAFEPMYKLITYPVELWYAGHLSAIVIKNYIPEQYLSNYAFFDVWMDAYGNDVIGNRWKKEKA